MEKILLVSSSDKIAQSLFGIINSMGEYQISTVKTAFTAREKIQTNEFDAVVINTPLSDETGLELADETAAGSACCVILIVKEELINKITEKYEKKGIIIVSKPISKQLFINSFKLACSIQSRLSVLKDENDRLKVQINEISIINRAKCVLIQYLGMTEPMAHRYLEKQAMDMRISKRQVAENILTTYEQ